jgi:hypothetical protein
MLTDQKLTNLFGFSKHILGFFAIGFAGFTHSFNVTVGNHDCLYRVRVWVGICGLTTTPFKV